MARTFLEMAAVEDQLKATAHFGVLKADEAGAVSRYDYALVHASVLLTMKQEHAGLGLSSKLPARYQLPTTKTPSLLEVAQSIIVLLNCGHLFGTFATERAVLYQLLQTPELRTQYVSSFNEASRADVERIIASRSIYHFHHTCALLFAGRQLGAIDGKLAGALLHLYLTETADEFIAKLRWLISASRTIAYNEIHSRVLRGRVIRLRRDELVRSLRTSHYLGFHRAFDEQTATLHMLEGIDAYAAETLFNDPSSAAAVVAHLHEYVEWRQIRGDSEAATVVYALFRRPDDWNRTQTAPLPHQLSLILPCLDGYEWDQLVSMLAPGRENPAWECHDFIVTPLPRRADGLTVEVYGEGLPIECTRLLQQLLHAMSCKMWAAGTQDSMSALTLWRAVADFGMFLLSQTLKPTMRPVLDPWHPAVVDGRYGYAVAGSGERGVDKVRELAELASGDRRKELLCLHQYICQEQLKGDVESHWLALIGSTRIEGGHDTIAELDGVLLEFQGNQLRWHFLEVKAGQRVGSGKKQLERFRKKCFLRTPSDRPRQLSALSSKASAMVVVR